MPELRSFKDTTNLKALAGAGCVEEKEEFIETDMDESELENFGNEWEEKS